MNQTMDFNAAYDEERPRMKIINCVDLVETRYDRIDWIVEGLLKPGLSVLAGAPKIGKSWMVLQLCMAVAKGEPFLGMNTRQSGVLYITLEDSEKRLQERVLRMTGEVPDKLNITLDCPGVGETLKKTLAVYCGDYPSTRLVVIDTFQKIREQENQMTYAGDYAEVSAVKQIADELKIAILLVHHTRKLSDSDCINEIAGTNGIAGSADSLMILKKEKRESSKAILSATGRDIEDRSMELNLNRDTCAWEVISDNYQPEHRELPGTLLKLIVFMQKLGNYDGTNAAFCEQYNRYSGENLTPHHLKRLMNLYRYELEDAGVYFLSLRGKNGRRLAVYYHASETGLSLSLEDAAEEASLWDAPLEKLPMDEMPPLPGDEDAPPPNRAEREYLLDTYAPYR